MWGWAVKKEVREEEDEQERERATRISHFGKQCSMAVDARFSGIRWLKPNLSPD